MLLDLREICKKIPRPIVGVIHIGAHYGEENEVYEDLEIHNRMFFEPLSKNFKVLKDHVGKWPCHNFALGSKTMKAEMFVESANNGQSSSLLQPGIHLKQYPHIQFDEREDVDVKKLDDVAFDRSKYNFINIDVQGYELEVFKGSEETLKSVDYIMTEVNRDEVYLNCAKVWELDDFLESFGFKRTATTWDGITWGDAFYEKS
tara:strand:- start:1524 stop:2132 length:609 start_codon:yes stop_codon:yes gene_type:complete